MPFFENMDIITEILVSHGKEESYFEKTNPKIKNLKHWDLNKNLGLTLRFYTASTAINQCVLIIDDDIYAPESTIQFLYEKWLKQPNNIHGIYGRILNNDFEYKTDLVWGNCHVVLTRLMMINRKMCEYFILHKDRIENELIKNSKPYWNGEDITMSLLSIQFTGLFPVAYNLKHYNRLHIFDLAIGISWHHNHKDYRKKLSAYVVNELRLNKNINELPKNYQKGSNFYYEFLNSPYYWYFISLAILLVYPLFEWFVD